MVTDKEAYDDYRYELRVASALARSGGQLVLRLAGKTKGPDIEALSKDGSRVGIACYRARHATKAIGTVQDVCNGLVRSFIPEFTRNALPLDVGIEVIFPRFPPSSDHLIGAERAWNAAWGARSVFEHADDSGVQIRRCTVLRARKAPGVKRRARIRFLFPLPQGEQSRIEKHIADKVVQKESPWATDFEGVALFCVEQSPFVAMHNAEQLYTALADQSPFAGYLSTRLNYPPSTRGWVHGLEEISYHLPNLPRFHLGLGTFGQNDHAWRGAATVEHAPKYAETFWDIEQIEESVVGRLVKSLNYTRNMRRIPVSVDASSPRKLIEKNPDLPQRMGEAAAELINRPVEEVFDW